MRRRSIALLLLPALCALLLLAGYDVARAQAAPATAADCPAGTTFVKGYTKKSGTAVAPHCKAAKGMKSGATPAAMATPMRMKGGSAMAPSAMSTATSAMAGTSKMAASAPAPGSTACPTGKSYVHGYTRKSGKQVAGYCRTSPSK